MVYLYIYVCVYIYVCIFFFGRDMIRLIERNVLKYGIPLYICVCICMYIFFWTRQDKVSKIYPHPITSSDKENWCEVKRGMAGHVR